VRLAIKNPVLRPDFFIAFTYGLYGNFAQTTGQIFSMSTNWLITANFGCVKTTIHLKRNSFSLSCFLQKH